MPLQKIRSRTYWVKAAYWRKLRRTSYTIADKKV